VIQVVGCSLFNDVEDGTLCETVSTGHTHGVTGEVAAVYWTCQHGEWLHTRYFEYVM